MIIYEHSTPQVELYLAQMSQSDLLEHFQHRLQGYELPKLNLELKPGTEPRRRPPRYPVPAGLRASLKHALNNQIKKGYMRRVPFSHKYWITTGFAKKKGRSVICPETGTEYASVRCLGNFTALNACTKPPPAHFFFQIPDQRGCSLRF